jgi:hypothetical protein
MRCKRAWVARPGLGLAPPVLVWTLLDLSCTSSSHALSPGKIITLEKSYPRLSFGRSLKLKNTQNRSFLFYRVINLIKGIDGKSRQLNAKHEYNIS